jgi:SNF2 family DNA or RNA helicase
MIRISDTPENCRELEWFMARYPMRVEAIEYLTGRARWFDQQLELIAKIIGGHYAPREMRLAEPGRDYQLAAAELLFRRHGYLLADKVGLGKTVSAFCAFTQPETLPALVVTLTHLPTQWVNMLHRFLPAATAHVIQKGTPYRYDPKKGSVTHDLARAVENGKPLPDVIVMSYSKLAGWAPYLKGLVRSVTFDEVQELRRESSAKYEGALEIAQAATYRLGLSATPIYNFGGEIYNILNVLAPDELGTREEFYREWCTSAGNGKYSVNEPEVLSAYLREQGLMLRRTGKDVGREVTEPQEIPHFIDADLDAFKDIESDATALARIITAQGGYSNTEKWKASGELDYKMRQATGIAKAPYVAEFCKMLLDSEEKIVLFGWHHEFYRLVGERLAEFNPVFYTGQETTRQKDAAKKAFCEGSSRVMIISLRAGAGMDGLQFVSHVCVFGELDWSPGVHTQCVGRLARDGQEDLVAAYFLVCNHGSDPIMADTLGLKKQQSDGLLDPNAPRIEEIGFDQTGSNVKKLAESYLAQRGITVGKPMEMAVGSA